jgi:hypothetical protein
MEAKGIQKNIVIYSRKQWEGSNAPIYFQRVVEIDTDKERENDRVASAADVGVRSTRKQHDSERERIICAEMFGSRANFAPDC